MFGPIRGAVLRLAPTFARRLAGWVVHGLVRLLLLFAALLVTAYVVVSWGVRPDDTDRSGRGRPADPSSVASEVHRPEADSLSRVNCALGPRAACERYVVAARAYEAWKAQVRRAAGGAWSGSETAASIAGAERRVRREVRRRAFDEAVRALEVAREAVATRYPVEDSAPDPEAGGWAGRGPAGAPLGSPPSVVGESGIGPVWPRVPAATGGIPAGSDAGDPPIRLTVRSDRNTLVLIRGVRALGRFERITVALPPGSYVFQGHREGYATVRVAVAVAPGTNPAEVTVLCDRPI